MTNKNWYKQAVGYQIYPKSFKDSNGDGIGDIRGIIEKLPYLKSLGIDFIWLNPIYASPQVDGGYDISDFYAVDPMFGTLDDLRELLDKVHKLGMKLIMDLVVNHTSDQHQWFIESQKSKDNPYRDYYLWADATPDQMPNDWQSFFGYSTWTYDPKTEQAYFHVFAPQQPDLNWKNPKLREEIYKMVRWWLEDVKIDGFRLDAISHIQKAPWDTKIKSLKGNDPWQPFMNVAGIDDYMRDLKNIFDAYDCITVGEASGVTSKEASDWTDPKTGYIQMIFELEHNARKWNEESTGSIYGYKKTIMRWQLDLLERGWNALYLENHDQPRAIDIFGDGSIASAKALAVSYMLLRGTPFIYQGQEIGMSNFPFTDISQVSTADTLTHYYNAIKAGMTPEQAFISKVKNSRDVSRTPMQWDASPNSGFTTGKPWFPLNPNYKTVNVEIESDILDLYRALIQLRHDEKAISAGSIKFHAVRHPSLFIFEREEFLIITNLSKNNAVVKFEADFDLNDYEPILASKPYKLKQGLKVEQWTYLVYKKSKKH